MDDEFLHRKKKKRDKSGIALKMTMALIVVLIVFMNYFNNNLDQFDNALNETDNYLMTHNITENPKIYDTFATGGERVFYPHHLIIITTSIGVLVVIVFAVYILNNIDSEPGFEDRYGD